MTAETVREGFLAGAMLCGILGLVLFLGFVAADVWMRWPKKQWVATVTRYEAGGQQKTWSIYQGQLPTEVHGSDGSITVLWSEERPTP